MKQSIYQKTEKTGFNLFSDLVIFSFLNFCHLYLSNLPTACCLVKLIILFFHLDKKILYTFKAKIIKFYIDFDDTLTIFRTNDSDR